MTANFALDGELNAAPGVANRRGTHRGADVRLGVGDNRNCALQLLLAPTGRLATSGNHLAKILALHCPLPNRRCRTLLLLPYIPPSNIIYFIINTSVCRNIFVFKVHLRRVGEVGFPQDPS